MDEILCATRGGEGSRAVQLAAIARAKETDRPLTFLYVAAPSTLGDFEPSLRTAVGEELGWMGKALLYVAQQRALAAQLHAKSLVREGEVRDEICAYVEEHNVYLLLLGAPRGTTANVFGDDLVEQFAESVHKKTGVPVEIIRPEASPVSR